MAENFSIDLNNKSFLIQEEKKPVIQKSADEEKYFSQLRDCFNAGYQFPQYCIDNNIKKPLFVGVDESQKTFLWELHAQFKYDRRINATFALMTGELLNFRATFPNILIPAMYAKNLSEMNLTNFDKVIILKDGVSSDKKNIYLKQLNDYFFKRVHLEIPLLDFAQKNPGVKVIHIGRPILWYNKNLSETEKKILADKSPESGHIIHLRNKLIKAQAEGKIIQTPYDFLGYSNKEVLTYITNTGITANPDGSDSLNDNEAIGIKNGRRMTANQPKNYKNTILFVGSCVYYGYGMPYDKTVASQLQNLLNENNLSYIVENCAQFIAYRQQSVFYTLNANSFRPGDIVFVFLDDFHTGGCKHIPFLDLHRILDRPHNYGEVFPDRSGHINENGHRAVADYLFKYLTKNNFFQDVEFNYPPPPIASSSLWYPERKFFKLDKSFAKSAA